MAATIWGLLVLAGLLAWLGLDHQLYGISRQQYDLMTCRLTYFQRRYHQRFLPAQQPYFEATQLLDGLRPRTRRLLLRRISDWVDAEGATIVVIHGRCGPAVTTYFLFRYHRHKEEFPFVS